MILVGIINVRKYYIRSYKLTLEADMKQAKVLTEKELKKVVDYINGMDRHAVRNRTMLLLTHYCGMRVNEIANLKKSDVVDDKGNIVDVIYLKATLGNHPLLIMLLTIIVPWFQINYMQHDYLHFMNLKMEIIIYTSSIHQGHLYLKIIFSLKP